jgi:predicted ABC-type transport system involved in lysophospholipase L1 biosynthesis ATPase subunit
LVTHDMALASRCERQMVLNNGRVVVAAWRSLRKQG